MESINTDIGKMGLWMLGNYWAYLAATWHKRGVCSLVAGVLGLGIGFSFNLGLFQKDNEKKH